MSCSFWARSFELARSSLLEQLDGEQLALVVPFVHRRVGVQALVALQPDQARVAHRGQHLGHLGLADAGVALEQQRPFEILHQQQGGHQAGFGDVAGARQVLLPGSQLLRAPRMRHLGVLMPPSP